MQITRMRARRMWDELIYRDQPRLIRMPINGHAIVCIHKKARNTGARDKNALSFDLDSVKHHTPTYSQEVHVKDTNAHL